MKNLLLLIFILSASLLNAQQTKDDFEIGYYVDINGTYFDGYFDNGYYGEKSLEVQFAHGEELSRGHYYHVRAGKIEGKIKYLTNSTFEFIDNARGRTRTLSPKYCTSFVVGQDSFIVVDKHKIKKQKHGLKFWTAEYIRVFEELDNFVFYQHDKISDEERISSFLYKADTSELISSFPRDINEFKDVAASVFAKVPTLADAIQTGLYTYQDIPSLIKMLKYHQKYSKNEFVYFDSCWSELKTENNSKYYAKILGVNDSIFHIKYFFNDNTPIYEGHYINLYPHVNYGDFTWFYPNGQVRKEVTFEYNLPLRTVNYYKNGQIFEEIEHFKERDVCKHVYSPQGQTILDSLGNGTLTTFVDIQKKELTFEYLNHHLKSVSYNTDSCKIYLLCEKNAKFNDMRYFRGLINESLKYPKKWITENIHGYMMVSCIIGLDGKLSDFSIVKGLDVEHDKIVKRYFYRMDSNDGWDCGEMAGQKVIQEVLFPIDFSIYGYSHARTNTYVNAGVVKVYRTSSGGMYIHNSNSFNNHHFHNHNFRSF
ncbi:energy transducer TonB [bacterium]|nr:energy transducer TonB [bacterium]